MPFGSSRHPGPLAVVYTETSDRHSSIYTSQDADHLCRCAPRHHLWGLPAACRAGPVSPAPEPAADAARPGCGAGSWRCGGEVGRHTPAQLCVARSEQSARAVGLCTLDTLACAVLLALARKAVVEQHLVLPIITRLLLGGRELHGSPCHLLAPLPQTAPRSRRASAARMSPTSASTGSLLLLNH